MSAELLEQAIALSQAGRQQEACELLVQVIAADVHNEPAWLLYANALPDEADRVRALEECLLHNPSSREAQEELAALKGGAPPKPPTNDRPRTPTVPGSVPAKTTGAPRRRLAYALGGFIVLTGAAALLLLGWWLGQREPAPSPGLVERMITPSTVSSGSEVGIPATRVAEVEASPQVVVEVTREVEVTRLVEVDDVQADPQQWEYKTLLTQDPVWGPFGYIDSGTFTEDGNARTLNRLNALGLDGWELVGIAHNAGEIGAVLVFKRPLD